MEYADMCSYGNGFFNNNDMFIWKWFF